MSDLIGKTLGKYEVLDLIGQGGMAEVYRAFQPGLDRVVAIKVVHGHLARDTDFLGRFKREAQAVSDLRHPNIIQLYDFDVEGTRPYMVLEYLDGVTLGRVIDHRFSIGQNLELREVLVIMQGICSALDYAHSRGLVHRDITPANVMLTKDQRVILTDFGLVKILGGMKLTVTGQVTGTPEYMSPEQAHGASGDSRSDIYSLGILLYEILTGTTPFQGESPVSILLKHVSYPIPPLKEHRSDIPDEFEAVIAKALAKNPDDRFQSGGEFWQAILSACPKDLIPDSFLAPISLYTINLYPSQNQTPTQQKLSRVTPSASPTTTSSSSAKFPSYPQSSPSQVLESVSNHNLQQLPSDSSSQTPLFSIEQVGAIASQIIVEMEETRTSRTNQSLQSQTPSNFNHSAHSKSFSNISIRLVHSLTFGLFFTISSFCVLVLLCIFFKSWTKLTPYDYWSALRNSENLFAPQTFSIGEALPKTFAFSIIVLYAFSIPGMIFGSFFRKFSRALEGFLNAFGFLFIVFISLLALNTYYIFYAIDIPVIQFTLSIRTTLQQLVSIATFSPTLPVIQVDQFVGELKQQALNASASKTLTSAMANNISNICSRVSVMTNHYISCWSLAYGLILTFTVGSFFHSTTKHRVFFITALSVVLMFFFFLGPSMIKSGSAIHEINFKIIGLNVAPGSERSILWTWEALLLGAFIAAVLGSRNESTTKEG